MTARPAQDQSSGIDRRVLRGFPAQVQDLLMEVINDHGATYRMPDGMHLLLYNGDRKVRPFKVAASRPAEWTIPYVKRWATRNLPTTYADHLTGSIGEENAALLRAAVEPEPEPGESEPEPVTEQEGPLPSLVFQNGKVSQWMLVDEAAGMYRCRDCDFARAIEQGVTGLHMHERHHSGAASAAGKAGVPKRLLSMDQRRIKAEAAVQALMDHFHIKDQSVRVAALERENAALRQQVADLKAKHDLIKQAMTL